MKSIAPRLLLGFLALFISCSSSIEINHFSVPRKFSQRKHRNYMVESVGIENFTSPSLIRRNEIILRTEDQSRLVISSHHLWSDLPEEMATQSLKDYLKGQNLFRYILPYPTSHQVVYMVEGHLHQFEINISSEEWKTRIALEVYLIKRKQGKIVWSSGIMQKSRLCAHDYVSASRSMGISLNLIWQKLERKLRVFLENAQRQNSK